LNNEKFKGRSGLLAKYLNNQPERQLVALVALEELTAELNISAGKNLVVCQFFSYKSCSIMWSF